VRHQGVKLEAADGHGDTALSEAAAGGGNEAIAFLLQRCVIERDHTVETFPGGRYKLLPVSIGAPQWGSSERSRPFWENPAVPGCFRW
jgi:hypothetical protein